MKIMKAVLIKKYYNNNDGAWRMITCIDCKRDINETDEESIILCEDCMGELCEDCYITDNEYFQCSKCFNEDGA